jgi:hypothetical protein
MRMQPWPIAWPVTSVCWCRAIPRPYVVCSGSTGVQWFHPLCCARGVPVWNVPIGVQQEPTLRGSSQGGAHCVVAPEQQLRVHVPGSSSGSLYPLPVETVNESLPGEAGGVPLQVSVADSGASRLTATLVMYGSRTRRSAGGAGASGPASLAAATHAAAAAAALVEDLERRAAPATRELPPEEKPRLALVQP